jgi:hypothetical protein
MSLHVKLRSVQCLYMRYQAGIILESIGSVSPKLVCRLIRPNVRQQGEPKIPCCLATQGGPRPDTEENA